MMLIKKILKISVLGTISASLFLLSACSTGKNETGGEGKYNNSPTSDQATLNWGRGCE